MISGSIDSDPKWEWASSKACRGPMDEAHAKLNSLIKDNALSQEMIVASDINDLKVGKDASSLAGYPNHIVATFQPAVKPATFAAEGKGVGGVRLILIAGDALRFMSW